VNVIPMIDGQRPSFCYYSSALMKRTNNSGSRGKSHRLLTRSTTPGYRIDRTKYVADCVFASGAARGSEARRRLSIGAMYMTPPFPVVFRLPHFAFIPAS